MAKKNLPKKDLQGSKFRIVIYFFKDATQTTTRKQDLYSKFIGQNEPRNSFEKWRERIHRYRYESEFGINWGGIYNNQDHNREKEPLLKILGNGTEISNLFSTDIY